MNNVLVILAGLEIWGTFSRQNGQPRMEMTFTNKAMQAMSGFAIQLNKNRLVLGYTIQCGDDNMTLNENTGNTGL